MKKGPPYGGQAESGSQRGLTEVMPLCVEQTCVEQTLTRQEFRVARRRHRQAEVAEAGEGAVRQDPRGQSSCEST